MENNLNTFRKNKEDVVEDYGLSGNKEIDKFLQEQQSKATNNKEKIVWIPYERLEIEKDEKGNDKILAQGGFGKVYKAEWKFGNREKNWLFKLNDKFKIKVVLKVLNNSQDIKTDFLQEILNHALLNDKEIRIVPCYGISQHPETKDYIMVMKYMEDGNLREHLRKDFDSLLSKSWLEKTNEVIGRTLFFLLNPWELLRQVIYQKKTKKLYLLQLIG